MSFSVGSVQNFVQPRVGHYINPQSLQQIASTLDRNRDGQIGRDELNISHQLRRTLDRNRDNRIQLHELTNALSDNQISIQGFSRQAARQIAGALINQSIYTFGLGQIGQTIDTNYDGFVTRRELADSLSRGTVMVSGNYLVPTRQGGGYPNPQPPTWPPNPQPPVWPPNPGDPGNRPGYGVDAREAREHISSLQTNKMKKDRWGNYDPTTGIFTPKEANQKINNYLETRVLESQNMTMTQKFDMLTSQKMKKDRWGNYDPAVGSLTGKEAQALAEKIAKAAKSDEYQTNIANDFISALTTQKMKKDRWGNDDYGTGLLTNGQANSIIKDFINNTVINSTYMGSDEKLALIKGQMMQKDRWGNYDPHTGSLTAAEVNELSKRVFEGR